MQLIFLVSASSEVFLFPHEFQIRICPEMLEVHLQDPSPGVFRLSSLPLLEGSRSGLVRSCYEASLHVASLHVSRRPSLQFPPPPPGVPGEGLSADAGRELPSVWLIQPSFRISPRPVLSLVSCCPQSAANGLVGFPTGVS